MRWCGVSTQRTSWSTGVLLVDAQSAVISFAKPSLSSRSRLNLSVADVVKKLVPVVQGVAQALSPAHNQAATSKAALPLSP